MKLKHIISMICKGFLHILKNVSVIKNGQKTNYAILQTAHRLEKGLCIRNPRNGWGYDKADQLVSLLELEMAKVKPDNMAVEIGKAVLEAYVANKEMLRDDNSKLNTLKSKINVVCRDVKSNFGGSLHLHKEDVLQEPNVEQLFFTRHSVRDFADTPVDSKKLEKAVALAMCAPSACNRQASQIYVISGEDRIKAGSSNEYNADKYLIITGNMRAFGMSELNDWIVSTSVFCGYLSLALHAENIGSCIFRKDIVNKSKYNDSIRTMCNIPDDEQIILEMAIGNYKDEFNVPVSYRKDAKDCLHYLT